ncbi:MAG: hypothetical protein KA296_13735 [Marinobacter sp.]|nr:hypothetical protein [Marinobacter sp.]
MDAGKERALMLPAMALSGGSGGGVDLSAGPATSGADSNSGGAVFNFAPPARVQQTQSITMTLAVVAIVGLVLWLQSQK